MTWKAIGQSVTGTSHIAVGKGCEDYIQYKVVKGGNSDEVLICCAGDGAGSARHAARASDIATRKTVETLADAVYHAVQITESVIYNIAEQIYDGLATEAKENQVDLSEYSCTLLGCCIANNKAVFFQVGDGAIVRNDGSGYYTPIWWPHNGEYQNSTSFLIDDRTFSNLNITILDERIDEIALFTDGLQMLALTMEGQTVYQPFFTGLFPHLRTADGPDKINILNRKLEEYLNSRQINDRTDDDKTLFLATRLSA